MHLKSYYSNVWTIQVFPMTDPDPWCLISIKLFSLFVAQYNRCGLRKPHITEAKTANPIAVIIILVFPCDHAIVRLVPTDVVFMPCSGKRLGCPTEPVFLDVVICHYVFYFLKICALASYRELFISGNKFHFLAQN